MVGKIAFQTLDSKGMHRVRNAKVDAVAGSPLHQYDCNTIFQMFPPGKRLLYVVHMGRCTSITHQYGRCLSWRKRPSRRNDTQQTEKIV